MPERHRTAVAHGSSRWTLASAVLLVGGALAVAATVSAGAEARSAAVPANVSPPTISGSAVSGETVTAGSGSWSGTLPITYGYEWQRCDAAGAACAPIAGATGVGYVVASDDVGSTLRVLVTASNAEGSASATSGATAVVTTPVAPAPTAEPVVSGTVVEGSTLSTTNGSWTGTPPIAFTYQWLRCAADGGLPDGSNCALIAGATGASYTLASADVGQRLRVRVTGSNGAGTGTATSNATAEIQQSTTIGAPRNTEEPSISGTTTQGRILTALVGTWAGATPLSYSYQWVRCPADGGLGDGSNCATISGASSRTYTLAAGDVGSRMRVRVTSANGLGSQTAASNATAVVAASSGGGSSGSGSSATGPRNTGLPTIVGTAVQGQALTATAGVWTGTTPIFYSYQWLRCDADGGDPSGADCDLIDDADSARYVVTREDVGRRLRVEVEADNVEDFEYATSDATAVVTATTATTPTTPTAPSGPLPPGAIRLSDGKYSIPVTSVSAPERLVVDSVTFSPNPVRSRSTPLEVRVHVVDTRGYVVRDALAFARATPLVTSAAPEQRTARDGWARIRLSPRGDFPLRSGYSVQFFVLVRKDGEPLLAGVSTRRLVQVATAD